MQVKSRKYVKIYSPRGTTETLVVPRGSYGFQVFQGFLKIVIFGF